MFTRLSRVAVAAVSLTALACGGISADPDAPTLQEVSGEWMVLNEHDGALAVLSGCDSDSPSLTLDATTVFKNRGQYGESADITAAVPFGDELIIMSRSESGLDWSESLRWAGDHTRLSWNEAGREDRRTLTLARRGDPTVPTFTECCDYDDEPMGTTYAWVRSGEECPPNPD